MREKADWATLEAVQVVVYLCIHQNSTLEWMHLGLAGGFPVNIMGGDLLLKMLMFCYPCYIYQPFDLSNVNSLSSILALKHKHCVYLWNVQ